MDRPIQVGDLVWVVRGHSCFYEIHGGHIFTVSEIVTPIGGGYTCQKCKIRDFCPNVLGAVFAEIKESYAACPITWLQRIPPLSEPEQIERKQEQPA